MNAGVKHNSVHLFYVYYHLRRRRVFLLLMLLLIAALPRQKKLLVFLSQRFLAHTRVIWWSQLVRVSFKPVNICVPFYLWDKWGFDFFF